MIANNRSVKERLEFGRNLRKKVKRTDHAHWDGNKRKHDPIEIIVAVNRERIAELVPIKMARMAVSPFGFYRGNVPVMAADLAMFASTGIQVQICGDAHVRNLGAYAGPDGRLIFDVNDFDETIRAPWEWDLKRLGTSLVLAGREAGDSERNCRDAVLRCADAYRTKLVEFSKMTVLEVHKYRIHRLFAGKPGGSVLQRAERATPDRSLAKLTVAGGDSPVFKDQKPVVTHPLKAVAQRVLGSLKAYRETLPGSGQQAISFYHPVDVVFKIVGTGSVGMHDYVVLHLAGDDAKDPLFLQVKEEVQSAYAPYVTSPETAMHQGQRVVAGQRMLQVQSDIMLGWTSVGGVDYLVRQMSDHKGSIEDEDLKGTGLREYATTCGEVLAKGHARSGDPAVLAGYLGNSDRCDKALVKFSVAYAEQTTKDYEAFKKAIRVGKVKAGKAYL